MKFERRWNGKSVSFFTKLEDPPVPLPGLHSPAKLFNIKFNADGSIYTNYFGGGQEVEERHVANGQTAHHRVAPIPPGKECRISIHGSGQVHGFIRGQGEVISHLGYELRGIDAPVMLAQHHIGTAGEYITDPFQEENADWLDGVFNAGDLMMVEMLLRLDGSGLLEEFPNLSTFVARAQERPAFRRAFADQLAVFTAATTPTGDQQ